MIYLESYEYQVPKDNIIQVLLFYGISEEGIVYFGSKNILAIEINILNANLFTLFLMVIIINKIVLISIINTYSRQYRYGNLLKYK